MSAGPARPREAGMSERRSGRGRRGAALDSASDIACVEDRHEVRGEQREERS